MTAQATAPYVPVNGWPGCARYTFRGRTIAGRNWVCSEDEGEALCAWCQAEQWRTYNEDLVGAFRMREDWIASLREPYQNRFRRSSAADATLFDLIDDCGSAPAAIAWIRSHPIHLGDFEELIPALECWDMTVHEAHVHMHKRRATP